MAGRVGRGGRALAALALLLGGTVVAFLMAEVVVRVALPPPQTVSIATDADLDARLAEENRQRMEVTEPELFVQTATGLRMRAGTVARILSLKGAGGEIVIRTNALGYRNAELGPKTRTRVLFLGDSITVAQDVPEEATFVRRVQILSDAVGEPLETINAAVAAIGLESEIAILRETGLRTEPDVVVLGFYLNDVEASPGVRVLQPPRFLEWSWFARHLGRVVPFLLRPETSRTGYWRELRSMYPPVEGNPVQDPGAFNASILKANQDWGSAWSPSAWRRLEPLLMEFKRLADEHDFRPLIVCFPVALQVRARFVYDHPQQRLRAVAARLGIPVLDLLPALREAAPGAPTPIFLDHCHYSNYGHELLAPLILGFIRANAGGGPGRAATAPPAR